MDDYTQAEYKYRQNVSMISNMIGNLQNNFCMVYDAAIAVRSSENLLQ